MDHFGRVRKLIWTFLHFPFHMALVLVMEGTNQFVVWRHVIEIVKNIYVTFTKLPPNATIQSLKQLLNQTSENTFAIFPPQHSEFVYEQVGKTIDSLNASSTPGDIQNARATVIVELYKAVFENYGFEPKHIEGLKSEPLNQQLDGYYSLFVLVFRKQI
jgi:hypothetical protein